jgi:hypothetical protein
MAQGDKHEALMAAYIDALRQARAEALRNRENDFRNLVESFDGNEARAREAAAEAAPPSTDPYVIAVIREYWLAVDALNATVPANARVEPLDFVFGQLARRAPELYEFLSTLPFWPMGQDEQGRWV